MADKSSQKSLMPLQLLSPSMAHWVVLYANHLVAIFVARGASLAVSMETAGNEGHKRHIAIGCCQPGAQR